MACGNSKIQTVCTVCSHFCKKKKVKNAEKEEKDLYVYLRC